MSEDAASCEDAQFAYLDRNVTPQIEQHMARCARCAFLRSVLGAADVLGRDDQAIEEPGTTDPLPVGSMIGQDYRVTDMRQGGFGRVYFCEAMGVERYQRGDRRVALKTLLFERLRDPADRALFKAEAARWISLGAHPNLVHAYGIAMYQRLPFIVLEYIEGARTLQDEICAGRIAWPQAITVGLGVARGLAHAHAAAGLVHGDIKPLNILLTPAGAAKVTDFGLSVSAHSSAAGESSTVAGTRGYLAPEMLDGQPARTTATDIYAFGVTLFNATTGSYPFPPDVLGANLREPPPDPRELEPRIPDALAALIRVYLDRDPAARGVGFDAIARQLELLHRDLLHSPPPEDPPPDVPALVDALVNTAQSWLDLGEPRKAEASADQALQRNRKNWKAHNIRGLVHMEAHDHSAALACFGEAHALAPRAIEPLSNAALASNNLGRSELATRWLRLALQVCSELGKFASLDGCSHLLIELLPEKDSYNLIHRILAENPHAAITWNNRAVLMRRMGGHQQALESADRAIALNPVYARAWTNRANALVELGRFAEAVTSADRSLESDPTVSGAYTAKASALARLGRLPDARACIAEGLRLLPGNALLQRAREVFNR